MVEATRTVLSDITGAAPKVTEPRLGESGKEDPKTAYGEAQKWKGVVFPGNCSKPIIDSVEGVTSCVLIHFEATKRYCEFSRWMLKVTYS